MRIQTVLVLWSTSTSLTVILASDQSFRNASCDQFRTESKSKDICTRLKFSSCASINGDCSTACDCAFPVLIDGVAASRLRRPSAPCLPLFLCCGCVRPPGQPHMKLE